MNEPLSKQFIYFVMVKVVPTPRHPLYYEIGYGIMEVWLWDDSAEGAIDRAEAILKLIGYEVVGEMKGVKRVEDCTTLPAVFQPQISSVKQHGFATSFSAVAVGGKDVDFDQMLKDWFR